MRGDKKRYESGLVHFILVFLLLQCIFLSTSASANGGPILWINKSANASTYAQEEDILYTISFGNRAGAGEASKVTVVDILPDVEVLDISPPPSSTDGNNLTWVIDKLAPGEMGSISVLIKHPEISKLAFKEDSSVSGYGYVNKRTRLSTIEKADTLTNIATISATDAKENSSSVTVKLALVPDVTLKSLEHGSGYYKEDQVSSLTNINTNVKLSKDLSARHEPVSMSLPGKKTLQISSLWSDRNEALTDDVSKANSVSDDYSYMKSMDKETSYDITKTGIVYSVAGNFSAGIAQFHYDKQNSGGKVPGSQSDAAYISEAYHGDFQITQKMDAYGDRPAYEKEASGIGFVSSQKVVSCDLRSSEQGSGSYQSTESIQSGTILKNISLAHKPVEQTAGVSKIKYYSKWGETMYARNAKKGTEILDRFSSADYLQKNAIMSSSFLSMTGGFMGTNYLKARALKDIANSSEDALRLEQLLTGKFTLDTTIALGGTSSYAYPHINLTKKVLVRDNYTVTYRIWVNNDGNQTLAPVAVVDKLPAGSLFISSSLKPTVQGMITIWTLQILPLGETTVIDLKVKLADISPSVINRVQAAAKYHNRTIIAEASSSPYDTIQSEQEEDAYEKELKLWEETVYGPWAPPSCYNLNSSISCTCERDLDEYYNNLSEDCALIP
jgi:uncharacterized repeat protein (TIGR01451 family)